MLQLLIQNKFILTENSRPSMCYTSPPISLHWELWKVGSILEIFSQAHLAIHSSYVQGHMKVSELFCLHLSGFHSHRPKVLKKKWTKKTHVISAWAETLRNDARDWREGTTAGNKSLLSSLNGRPLSSVSRPSCVYCFLLLCSAMSLRHFYSWNQLLLLSL